MVNQQDFTPDAQQAFTLAEAEARAFNHNYIGQEHLLLGLLRLEEGPVPAIRDRFKITVEQVRGAITMLLGPGAKPIVGPIGMTPRLKRAVQLATDDAKAEWAVQLAIGKATAEQQPLTSSADLLCGLLMEGTGVGASVLQSFDITVEQIGEAIRPRPALVNVMKDALNKWADENRGLKRYLLTLPAGLFQEVQELADRQQTNVAELLRRFTRLGLLATRIQETPGAALIIREGETEQRVLLL